MTDDTFTYDGVELNAENTLRAIELVTEDDSDVTSDNTAIVGDVALDGDGFADGDVTVTRIEDGTEIVNGSIEEIEGPSTFTSVGFLREEANEVLREAFTEYVGDIDGPYDCNEVRDADDAAFEHSMEEYDAVLHYQDGSYPQFRENEIRGLVDDEGVEVGRIKSKTESGVIEIGLNDVRE